MSKVQIALYSSSTFYGPGTGYLVIFISSVLKSLENKAESWSREPTGNLFSFQSASNFERKIRSPAKTKTQHQL
jgi:hypothetical protein